MSLKEWQVILNADNSVTIDSADFTHDARLTLSGDFKTTDEKLDYAAFIAGKLNFEPSV